MSYNSHSMSPILRTPVGRRRRGRAGLWVLGAVLVVVVGLVLAGAGSGGLLGGGAREALEGAPVRRGPLRIAVTTGGGLRAAGTVSLTSKVEGRNAILRLVPEGTFVRKGDVVCELDASAMIEDRIQQTISVGNAEAALVKARQNYQIQLSQNRSDINKARQAIEFAEQDLAMFLEGERASELQASRQAIDLAKEEAERAASRLTWSETLAERGFLTATELEADRIAEHRAQVALEQAERELDLLERFRMPRRETELRALLEEARQEFERVELQAAARIIDFEADVKSCEATLGLERERLVKLENQIDEAKLRAPRDGLVVYAQRDHDDPPIQEGLEVRERQEILSIPSTDDMVAEVKLHESVLEQVEVGMPCTIKVDALPGVELDGQVEFVALLPDQGRRWLNPNLRVYRCDVAISTPNDGMRPGMSCSVEILIDEIADTLYVPVQAVFREGPTNVSFVVEGREITRREVEVGRYNELWVQVLGGLAEDEVVLLRPPEGYSAPSLAPDALDPEPRERSEEATAGTTTASQDLGETPPLREDDEPVGADAAGS
jgi:HlyD family secretion protein